MSFRSLNLFLIQQLIQVSFVLNQEGFQQFQYQKELHLKEVKKLEKKLVIQLDLKIKGPMKQNCYFALREFC